MEDEKKSLLYKKVRSLYEQAENIWKGVVFEIVLDPINPKPTDKPEHYLIDYSDCMEDFYFDVDESEEKLTLEELFNEIDKLHDYENVLRAAIECIRNIKEKYQNEYNVTVLRVLDHVNKTNESEYESDPETSEDDEDEEHFIESEDEDYVEDGVDHWDMVWEIDSGLESPAEIDEIEEAEESYDSDSGAEPDWLVNWSLDSDSERNDDEETEGSSESESSS